MSAPGSGPSTLNASQRRSAARTTVVWEALRATLTEEPGRELRVLDIGGGTGGFAVRVAELGHHVTVVDPSPDALAILDRRSEETGVADRVNGVQGDLATVPELVEDGSVDVVLCHGVLEVVDDPRSAMAAIAGALRPGGRLSLLVSQRHAAVVARAMAGHFVHAKELLDDGSGPVPHRFTAEETRALLDEAGFTEVTLHAVRVFSDLVPSSFVDLEPGAADALVALEQAVAELPEYLPLATQVHALATRH
ncbi:MAG TPA: methyltransferase domain-containing protein [Marmoricola sp.]|nr:methyltransferase domain-containing protein [Marmoricola sp.]